MLLLFAVTVAAILLSDPLSGIAIGLTVGIFCVLKANHETAYHLERDGAEHDAPTRIVLSQETCTAPNGGRVLRGRGGIGGRNGTEA